MCAGHPGADAAVAKELPRDISDEVESVISALIAYGAVLGDTDYDDLTKQDHFFVTHW